MGPASSTLMELGGTGAGQYDRVIGVGKLTLDGVITVALIDGFTPTPGDSFDLFDYSLIDSSDFDPETDLILPNLMNGWDWDRSSFLANGQITAVPEPANTHSSASASWRCGVFRLDANPDVTSVSAKAHSIRILLSSTRAPGCCPGSMRMAVRGVPNLSQPMISAVAADAWRDRSGPS